MAELTINTTHTDSVPLLVLTGELDAYHAPRLRSELEAQLSSKPTRLVVSLKRVSYVDSTGLGTLVAFRKQAEASGVSILLVMTAGSAVERTFTITGLLPVFTIFDDDTAALEAAKH